MHLQSKSLAIFLFVSAVWRTESLQCLSCSGALNEKECNKTVTCSNEQVCYKKKEFTDQVRFELGCVDKQRCSRYDQLLNATTDKETYSGQTQFCYECCSTSNCNKDLCDQYQCKDSETINCAFLNSTISICETTDQAKKICKKFCGLCHIVDGIWSSWSLWSKCDVTCENGTQARTRSCTNPAPQYGGLNCSEEGIELKPCTRQLCPIHGNWSEWENWGTCSATCGIGMQSRHRYCTNPAPGRYGDHCFGHSIEDKLCNQSDCEIQSDWANWSQWGTCSATCGVGMQSRYRSCTINGNDGVDNNCDGNGFEDQLCYPGLCSRVWSEWQPWGDCSEKCETGLRTRSRKCVNPSPFIAEGDCPGASNDTESCPICKTDCYEIMKHANKSASGVYMVNLWKSKRVVQVYCDMDTTNGGWTVFQNRFNGIVDFYRNFSEYEIGFGNIKSEFWLGLKIVQEMASQYKSELRIDLRAADDTTAYETFQNFSLDSSPYYNLRIDPGQGTAGDSSGLYYNDGEPFSTFDTDRDGQSSINCAVENNGGWWYKFCTYANLNGEYVTPGTSRSVRAEGGVTYRSFKGYESLKATKMMFRRVE